MYLLNDSISAFKNNFLKQSLIQINELMEGISITSCTGMSADQLLSNGFQKIERDDTTFIYIFVSETEYKCADFINDIYYEIDLESTRFGPALISLRDDGDFETRMREFSSKLQSGFDKVRSLMGQFADLIDGLENKLLYALFFHGVDVRQLVFQHVGQLGAGRLRMAVQHVLAQDFRHPGL